MLEKKIKRKRRTAAERRALYDLWQKSGLNGSEFCRQNHISTRTIWKWRKEFGSEATNANLCNLVVPYPIDTIGTQQTTEDIKFYPLGRLSTNSDGNNNNNNVDNKNDQEVVDRNSLLEIMLPTGSIYKTYLSEASIKTILSELLK